MAYQYRGTRHDLTAPLQQIPAGLPKKRGMKPRPFDPSRCGTRAGYKQHQRRDVEMCQPCQDAHNAYMAAYMAEYNARKGGPRQLEPCGTYAGYRRHERAHETPCYPCTTAQQQHRAEYMRDYRARKAAA